MVPGAVGKLPELKIGDQSSCSAGVHRLLNCDYKGSCRGKLHDVLFLFNTAWLRVRYQIMREIDNKLCAPREPHS
jgi:hypothetical protein